MTSAHDPQALDPSASLVDRWTGVVEHVADLARAAGRDPGDVQILAAVKTRSVEEIVAVLNAGCQVVGHNRVQEITATIPGVREAYAGDLEVHMIGGLQTNKVNAALREVDVVQSVDRWSLAERLSRAAVRREKDLAVFVQVNASAEDTKGGVSPEEAVEFASRVAELDGLHLRGLMTIGANSPDAGVVRASLERMAELRDELVREPGLAHAYELSMGMSGDLEPAINAGSTMVRIGSAIFGPR